MQPDESKQMLTPIANCNSVAASQVLEHVSMLMDSGPRMNAWLVIRSGLWLGF
jgi:hypothetical protein